MIDQDRFIIKVFNQSFDRIGIITKYKSIQYTERWNAADDFEIHVPFYKRHLLRVGMIIAFGSHVPKISDKHFVGIINKVHIGWNKGLVTIIKGGGIGLIFDDRITIPPVGKDEDTYNAPAEDIILGLLNKNAFNPTEVKRKFPGIVSEMSQSRGEKIAFSSRYKILGEEVATLCAAASLGYRFELDEESKAVKFSIEAGADRTEDNADGISPYICSPELGRLTEWEYTESNSDYKSTAYVGGQGDGKDREIIILGGDASGFGRKEVFIDARDVGEDSETTLEDRGKLKLSEYPEVKSFEGKVRTEDYGKRFFLGDFVTIKVNAFGLSENRQVLEALHVREKDKKTVEVTFGEPVKTITQKMRRTASSAAASIQGPPGVDGKTPTFRINEIGHLEAIVPD